ncbi:nickel-dependent hydrogenase large subunit [Magnetococcales bacterium HHB-1]
MSDGHCFDFDNQQWRDYLLEETLPTSYAKQVTCKTQEDQSVLYRVGPLARLNGCDRIDTPVANAHLKKFQELNQSTICNQTVMYHYARLIELIYACEKMAQLIENDEIRSDNIRNMPPEKPVNHRATALIEAPRGVLIHDYQVDDDGIMTLANLIVATQQNLASINETIRIAASPVLQAKGNTITDDTLFDAILSDAIEFGIRCYDPCLSCATHRVGDMKMEIKIQQNGKTIHHIQR